MSRRTTALMLALAMSALASCEQSPTAPWRLNDGEILGTWSSPEMGLDLSETDGEVVFPHCAVGMIGVPIVVREDGTFDQAGTYQTIGQGAQAARWARYIGRIDNRRMTITVLLGDPIAPGGRDVYGPYDLEYGDDLPEQPACTTP
jgi:hypothetical protein